MSMMMTSKSRCWFIEKCSKLKSDFRYSAEFVFDTFPWPQFESDLVGRLSPSATATAGDSRPTNPPLSKSDIAKIEAVAEAGREVRRVRAEALTKLKGGLRALYRTLELPGANPLKDAHAALDTAVLTAYGFSAKKDLLAQLLSLNQQVAANIENGSPVTAPGVPKNYPDAKKLVTEDCVRPS